MNFSKHLKRLIATPQKYLYEIMVEKVEFKENNTQLMFIRWQKG